MRAKTDGSINCFGYTSLEGTIFENRHFEREKECCPFCNKNMIVKFGKYGPFWSCCDHPNYKCSKKILVLGNETGSRFYPNNIDNDKN